MSRSVGNRVSWGTFDEPSSSGAWRSDRCLASKAPVWDGLDQEVVEQRALAVDERKSSAQLSYGTLCHMAPFLEDFQNRSWTN